MPVLRCLVAMLLAVGLVSAVHADHHNEDLMAEVEALGDKIQKAMMADDVDTMLGFYVEDAISLPNFEKRLDGVDAFRAHHEQMKQSGMKILSFESDPTDVWAAGDQVVEIGTFSIELEMPGMPEPIQDKGKYMTVYVRDADGNLKIKAEAWNTDMNPMEMMGMEPESGEGGPAS